LAQKKPAGFSGLGLFWFQNNMAQLPESYPGSRLPPPSVVLI